MLGLLHSGSLLANQSQGEKVSSKQIDAAIAEGKNLRKKGRLPEALREFNRARALSRRLPDKALAARSGVLAATVELLLFQYSKALVSAREALRFANEAHDVPLAGAASGTITTIYSQLGDFSAANQAAEETVRILQGAPATDAAARSFLIRALQNQADLNFLQGKIQQAKQASDRSISMARAAGDKNLEALAWEVRGAGLLPQGDIPEISQAFQNAYSLRIALRDFDGLAVTKEHLAELELKRSRPDFPAALKLIDEAFASQSALFRSSAQHYPIHVRAKILLGMGDKSRALAEFKRAVDAADQWRQGALPGDITSTQTVASLNDIYRDFAQLAAEISMERHDPALAREGLEALAANRAASLREQIRRAFAVNSIFPPEYYKRLGELQLMQAQVTLGGNKADDRAKLATIRATLSDLENQINIFDGKNYISGERNLSRNSLKDIQSTLRNEQVLLSFSLGARRSFLWTLTSEQMNLYPLDSEAVLKTRLESFKETVRTGGDGTQAGQQLSKALFGKLSPREMAGREWLLVCDGSLLDGIPFAALPSPSDMARPLIGTHTLRLLPSELLLLSPGISHKKGTNTAAARFVGVGDPVYNFADSRIRSGHVPPEAKTISESTPVARLVGSAKELSLSAQQSGLPLRRMLTGAEATSEMVAASLAQTPEVVHFAVHVMSPSGQSQEAALALSLKNGVPEFLTPEVIATYRVPGSLVVMSGCASGQGAIVPSAGLIGLSRAWLLGGASAVVVSAWPTPDDSGRFFSVFYGHFREEKSGNVAQRAAAALAQTQLDVQRGSGYLSSPAFWAAYSIVSKE